MWFFFNDIKWAFRIKARRLALWPTFRAFTGFKIHLNYSHWHSTPVRFPTAWHTMSGEYKRGSCTTESTTSATKTLFYKRGWYHSASVAALSLQDFSRHDLYTQWNDHSTKSGQNNIMAELKELRDMVMEQKEVLKATRAAWGEITQPSASQHTTTAQVTNQRLDIRNSLVGCKTKY